MTRAVKFQRVVRSAECVHCLPPRRETRWQERSPTAQPRARFSVAVADHQPVTPLLLFAWAGRAGTTPRRPDRPAAASRRDVPAPRRVGHSQTGTGPQGPQPREIGFRCRGRRPPARGQLDGHRRGARALARLAAPAGSQATDRRPRAGAGPRRGSDEHGAALADALGHQCQVHVLRRLERYIEGRGRAGRGIPCWSERSVEIDGMATRLSLPHSWASPRCMPSATPRPSPWCGGPAGWGARRDGHGALDRPRDRPTLAIPVGAQLRRVRGRPPSGRLLRRLRPPLGDARRRALRRRPGPAGAATCFVGGGTDRHLGPFWDPNRYERGTVSLRFRLMPGSYRERGIARPRLYASPGCHKWSTITSGAFEPRCLCYEVRTKSYIGTIGRLAPAAAKRSRWR